MLDDDIVLVACKPSVAAELLEEDPYVISSLIVTMVVPDDVAILVKKKDFLDWIGNNGSEEKIK